MSQYLYGASVQGIQQFIFSTSKLKEIVGGSEIVEDICTTFFQKKVKNFREENLLIGAAGNIKYLFDSQAEVEAVFRDFPKSVMQKAPGITLSQAVIEIDDSIKAANEKLEERLRAARNRRTSAHGLGWMISERSRRTGNPSIKKHQEDYIDAAQWAKRKANESGSQNLLKKFLGKEEISLVDPPKEMKDLLHSGEQGWLAVIHADGNGLGRKLLKLYPQLSEDKYKDALRVISQTLEKATVSAVQKAYNNLTTAHTLNKLILRPIILGGDDLTIIIDGKYALDFTAQYLKAFEEKTREYFKDFREHFDGITEFEKGLTACAGIAFIKPNFPFHYAVDLSDTLCKRAKKVSKSISQEAPSSLMFHKVHSSHVSEYKVIVERELSTPGYRLDFGPYFIRPQVNRPSIEQLNKWVNKIKEEGAPASSLRNWLIELESNEARATQMMDRIKSLKTQYIAPLNLDTQVIREEEDHKIFTHFHDVLSIASIQK